MNPDNIESIKRLPPEAGSEIQIPGAVLTFIRYSLLNATTGSFFDAIFDGTSPAIKGRNILISTSITPACHGRFAICSISNPFFTTMLIGIQINKDTPIPMIPDTNPSIRVSALNTRDTSFFDAPTARRIPISFVLSRTEI